MKKGIFKMLSELWYGSDASGEKQKVPNAQNLQEAVALKMQAANAKGDAATAQMIAAQNARQELGKLVVQHDELKKQALLAERQKDTNRAKRVLALALAVKEKMTAATERYEQANKIATQLIQEAKRMFKDAKETSADLPRKVMQLEVNRMLENAAQLEGKTQQQIEGKPTYEALTASIDAQTQRLLIRGMIDETGDTLDGEIDQVLKDAEFEQEYKMLQMKAGTEDDVIEAELVEKDPAGKAKALLSAPAFGGLISGMEDIGVSQPEPIKVGEAKKTSNGDSE